MDIERIDCIEVLNALESDWLDLYARDVNATPFQRPEWLLPWWHTFGSGEMFSFAARVQGKLVALAPMFLHPWNGRRQVTFVGNGVSDHLDFLADPEYADAAVPAILNAIAAERSRWDLCDLQDLAATSHLFRAQASGDVMRAQRQQYICSSISLPSSWEQYHNSLPHGLRRNLRRYREQLDRCGHVTFESTHHAGELFDALVDLHRARWETKDDPGMLSSPSLVQFHKEAAARLAASGMVRLHALHLDGRVVAVVYLLQDRDRAYSYLGGFDPALSRYSPGALALEFALHQCISAGVRVFDFLRGEESYKSDWGARPEASYRLLLWHQQAPAELIEAA